MSDKSLSAAETFQSDSASHDSISAHSTPVEEEKNTQSARYAMVVDTGVCVGCQTCVVSCAVSHELPQGMQWAHMLSLDGEILYQPTGVFPAPVLRFRPTLCNHCSEPACAAACPVGAMKTDEQTGIVWPDPDECIGCGACVSACPYQIPQIDDSLGVSRKCTFCRERVLKGHEPYCVASCPANARVFGDLSDPASEVAALVAAGAEPWMPEEGTQPNVYYVV